MEFGSGLSRVLAGRVLRLRRRARGALRDLLLLQGSRANLLLGITKLAAVDKVILAATDAIS
jgi:hypothetical protein